MDAVVKQGVLHTQQQQKFGKKWKKVWVLLYGESTCSVARLEYFEFKEGVSLSEKQSTRKTENKKVIKLSDCIRITEAPGESCPSDCRAFHLETIEKLFVFAAESSEYDDWSQTLCEMAFPMFWGEWPGLSKADGSQRSKKEKNNVVPMEENSLYSTRKAVKEFRVAVRKTEAADRCGLQGQFLLRVEDDSLQLRQLKSSEVVYTWPYKFLRRFGRDKVTFTFEAGRRCVSGEGSFEFDTKHANGIFQVIELAIKLVRQGSPREEKLAASDGYNEDLVASRPGSAQEAEEEGEVSVAEGGLQPAKVKGEMGTATLPALRALSLELAPEPSVRSASTLPWKPGSKGRGGQPRGSQPELQSTYSEVRDVIGRPGARGKSRKPREEVAAGAIESEYAIPFDSIARTLRLPAPLCLPAKPPDGGAEATAFSTFLPRASDYPLYDTIDERTFGQQEKVAPPLPPAALPRDHIYDEPEGSDAPSLYDYPEEVSGHAWRLRGREGDPSGHEYPYNPHTDDYAVPATAKRGASRGRSAEGSRPAVTLDSDSETEYDNILVRK
ncbi:docking protein 2-like [Rhinoraja longicauda]